MLNRITLIGNVGKEAEFKTFDNGGEIAKFSLATNESYKDKNDEWQKVTTWHTIKAGGKLVERVRNQIKKGLLLYVEGKQINKIWEKQDGTKINISEVQASTFRVLEKRENANQGGTTSSEAADDDLPL